MERVARSFVAVSAVVAVVSVSGLCSAGLTAGPQETLGLGDSILGGAFDLSGPRSNDVQQYEMETRVITYAPGGAPCAILAYDSGESSFRMLMEPMPDMEVHTVGSSRYYGDIHVDLATRLVRKATMGEMVVSETTVPGLPNKISTAIERSVTIRNTTDEDDGCNQ